MTEHNYCLHENCIVCWKFDLSNYELNDLR